MKKGAEKHCYRLIDFFLLKTSQSSLNPINTSYGLDLHQEQRNGAEHRLIAHLQVNNPIDVDSREDDSAMARNERTNRSMITKINQQIE